MVGIYLATKWQGKYPLLSMTEMNNYFSIYHTYTKILVCLFQYTKERLEMNLDV